MSSLWTSGECFLSCKMMERFRRNAVIAFEDVVKFACSMKTVTSSLYQHESEQLPSQSTYNSATHARFFQWRGRLKPAWLLPDNRLEFLDDRMLPESSFFSLIVLTHTSLRHPYYPSPTSSVQRGTSPHPPP